VVQTSSVTVITLAPSAYAGATASVIATASGAEAANVGLAANRSCSGRASALPGSFPYRKVTVMFTPDQYRKKASGYGELVKSATSRNQRREFQSLERSFTELADNEQWLSDNHGKIVRAAEHERFGGVTLAKEEEYVLRCLGAALILQWNTLPKTLQRELFDNAGSMGELMETAELRGQIARFLHKHKNDQEAEK
jgi:hypothetical protein